MTTAELARRANLPATVVLEILDAGLFGETVHMSDGQPVYTPGAIEVVRNVSELAGEVAASRYSPVNAWLTLRYLMRPTGKP